MKIAYSLAVLFVLFMFKTFFLVQLGLAEAALIITSNLINLLMLSLMIYSNTQLKRRADFFNYASVLLVLTTLTIILDGISFVSAVFALNLCYLMLQYRRFRPAPTNNS
ncbi:hypothetical protein [Catenovulum agarivorans]|uniref:hypothetical protein n=1 Tax=Catenovulum agarivorans TaxID=1172192 RepID=UPI0003823425|nr:hypothetical protein [Catenovulum agarivorans]